MITDEYIEIFEKLSKKEMDSMFNHVALTMCAMSFLNRLYISYMILTGRKFCLSTSYKSKEK